MGMPALATLCQGENIFLDTPSHGTISIMRASVRKSLINRHKIKSHFRKPV